ncbi:hypothetical protein Sj15T_13250 [Sphingobium sp. TA15]|uniref:Uncharacterized protein n=1 Tax=Sphingobium indicum (strain DSM 16413 / CCM 7287 / MTCC 6362 / UT26 / NBRC 101211 / UT26S) TaxID=452662 RepID=D4Z2N7_SPHIU|nr:hypothetical protein [Sphingobium indicum]BAI96869.1 hypothetical protein SJA_C1-20350 [Sphingobium indicum UT26S]BDD66304.1 hypothetical protein Sj15T_13250 [Sphingobium sp. TA15]
MNPNAHQPSREDVLDAFAVEPNHGREILERYLREYPHFSNELVDLSRELSRVPHGAERPMSLQEQAMVEAAWQQHMPIETKSAKDPLADLSVAQLREIAVQLDVPRQVVTAFRERRVVATSVPRRFLTRMAAALNCTVDLLVSTLTLPSGAVLARSYKSDGKPSAETAATFERLLIDAGVSEEKRTALLADGN